MGWLTNVLFENKVFENERLELTDKNSLYFLGPNLTLRNGYGRGAGDGSVGGGAHRAHADRGGRPVRALPGYGLPNVQWQASLPLRPSLRVGSVRS
ncbi:hypothetical protein [Archangium lansingense]|uniref:Uncharacterized protein n=1 Tax=Archangium lansingense TaxID=2995310 RepID=A0ABT4AIE6_9BACT|nr:hypothetical protein [Archangium lansinium]MCY1080974.1 hypothetical protein [Archangium lansinium]